jgi:8-oxo-dGTP pyrophosphatase MutT (NUDIX family)
MKQMYKVFINDNEVQFLANNAEIPRDCIKLKSELHDNAIVQQVAASGSGHLRFTIQDNAPSERFEKFAASFKMIEAAGGIVRQHSSQGPLLMIFRRGKWDLPKGKIDAGESPEAAAIREVREECGISKLTITGNAGSLFHLYELKGKWVIKKTWWYRMLCTDNSSLQPEITEDITEAIWVDAGNVYKLFPGAFASIAYLLKKEISGN